MRKSLYIGLVFLAACTSAEEPVVEVEVPEEIRSRAESAVQRMIAIG